MLVVQCTCMKETKGKGNGARDKCCPSLCCDTKDVYKPEKVAGVHSSGVHAVVIIHIIGKYFASWTRCSHPLLSELADLRERLLNHDAISFGFSLSLLFSFCTFLNLLAPILCFLWCLASLRLVD